ncbi:MAG: porin, partial [Beijerinckiaceae bacterium]
MKLFKSLLLGTAAGIVATSGAMAADLGAKKPSPVEYVRTCYNPLWGTRGGYIIPGTDTCLNISGRVRADYVFTEPGSNQINAFAGTGFVGLPSTIGGLPVFLSNANIGRNANATGTRVRG